MWISPYARKRLNPIKIADIISNVTNSGEAIAVDKYGKRIAGPSYNHSEVLKEAIDKLPDYGVLVLNGRFVLDSGLYVDKPIVIEGVDAKLVPKFTDQSVILKDWGVSIAIRNITIDSELDYNPVPRTIDDSTLGSQDTTAIYLKGGGIIVVEGVHVKNWGRHGIYIEGGQSSSTSNITHALIFNNVVEGSHYTSISSRDVTSLRVIGNSVRNQRSADYGISARYYSHEVIIMGNIVRDGLGFILADGVIDETNPFYHNVIISNNIGINVCCDIFVNAYNARIEGNIIIQKTQTPESGTPTNGNGITFSGKNAIISGNIVIGTGSSDGNRGISLGQVENIIVRDNYIDKFYTGVWVDDGGIAVIESNHYGDDIVTRCRIDSSKASFCDDVSYTSYTKSSALRNRIIKYYENNHYMLGVLFGGLYFRKRMMLSGENAGTATLSGDGTTTDFLVGPHNIVPAPTDPSSIAVYCTPASPDAINASPVTCYLSDEDGDGTYESIRAKFQTAPASGTDNVKLSWYAVRP